MVAVRLKETGRAVQPAGAAQVGSRGIVEVRGVGKTYDGGVEALRDIHLDFPEGALTSLLGPSGCEQTRRKFQEDLLQLVKDDRKTFIFVTHSIEEAVYVSDRIVLLSPRPGRVAQVMEPSIDRTMGADAIRRDRQYLDTVEEIWRGLRAYVE